MLLRGILLAWLAAGAYVATQIILVRCLRPRLYYAVSKRLFAVWLVGYAAVAWRLGVHGWPLANGVLVFGSLWIMYMEFSFIALRSLSVWTVAELSAAVDGRLPIDELDRRRDLNGMFDRRIDNLVANGYLREDGARVSLTARGRRFAALFHGMRRLLRIEQYG